MLENILVLKQVQVKTKVKIKTIVSVALIALAVGLPQLVHLFAGAQGGMLWLPMYLPILIGGALLGVKWGLGVAVISPVVSFLLTSLLSLSPMPTLERLPFMIAELAVFAVVSGAFSKLIFKNVWLSIPAVLLSVVAGRLSFLALVAIFQSVSSLSTSLVLNQILMSWPGVLVQLVLVPLVVILLKNTLAKEKNDWFN